MWVIRFAFVLIAVWVSAPARGAEDAGRLVNPKGKVIVIRGKAHISPPDGYRLHPQDRIVLPAGASARVEHFRTGKLYHLAARTTVNVEMAKLTLVGGKATAGQAEPRIVETVKIPNAGLRTGVKQSRLVSGPPNEFSSSILGLRTRGKVEKLELPEPCGAVMETNVTCRWVNHIDPAAAPKDAMIDFVLLKDGEREAVLNLRLPISANSCDIGADKLEVGKLYRWEVTAVGQGIGLNITGAPLFVARESDQKEIKKLDALAEQVRKLPTQDSGLELLLAKGYVNAGLFLRAFDAFRNALAADPACLSLRERHALRVKAVQVSLLTGRHFAVNIKGQEN